MRKRNAFRAVALFAALVVILIIAMILHGVWVLHDIPLIRAVGEGNVDNVKSLVSHGANVNEHSRMMPRWTPLIVAVNANESNMVHYLIGTGADVNLAEGDGKTPLICAVELGDRAVPIVKELIAHGANLEAKDNYGGTAYGYSESRKAIDSALFATLEEAKRDREAKSDKK
jgi:ankyrin repeat protein